MNPSSPAVRIVVLFVVTGAFVAIWSGDRQRQEQILLARQATSTPDPGHTVHDEIPFDTLWLFADDESRHSRSTGLPTRASERPEPIGPFAEPEQPGWETRPTSLEQPVVRANAVVHTDGAAIAEMPSTAFGHGELDAELTPRMRAELQMMLWHCEQCCNRVHRRAAARGGTFDAWVVAISHELSRALDSFAAVVPPLRAASSDDLRGER
jgi:hypothetical protein